MDISKKGVQEDKPVGCLFLGSFCFILFLFRERGFTSNEDAEANLPRRVSYPNTFLYLRRSPCSDSWNHVSNPVGLK